MSQPIATILITGFGPFPGAPDNPSGHLVNTMAKRFGQKRLMGAEIAFGVLPTHWQNVGPELDKLFTKHEPNFTLHIGYAAISNGFQLESTAYNQTCAEADVEGVKGSCGSVIDGHRAQLTSALPLDKVEKRMSASGFSVSRSDNPGRYLCNMAYFLALSRSGSVSTDRERSSLFIHIPAIQTHKRLIPEGHQGEHHLSLEEACQGLELIMTILLEKRSSPRDGRPSMSA